MKSFARCVLPPIYYALDYEIVSWLLLRLQLEQQLADAPDVLTVEQIACFTGYTPHTVYGAENLAAGLSGFG